MKRYFISKNNIKSGPFSIEQLKDQNLNLKDLVWTEEFTDWRLVEEVEELKSVVTIIPPKTKYEIDNEILNLELKKEAFTFGLAYVILSFFIGFFSSYIEYGQYMQFKTINENCKKMQAGGIYEMNSIRIYDGNGKYYLRWKNFLPGANNESLNYEEYNSEFLKPYKAIFTEVYLNDEEQNNKFFFTISMIKSTFLNNFFIFIFIFIIYVVYRKNNLNKK